MYLLSALTLLATIFSAIYLSSTATTTTLPTLSTLITLLPSWIHTSPPLPTSVPGYWNTYGYLFNITVGTPPQTLTVLSDWAWMSLFARSGRCLNTHDPALCVAPGQTFYNETASTSYSPTALPQLQWPTNLFCPQFTVDYISDTICLTPSLCTPPSTTFQASHFPFSGDWIPIQPFTGIFGMAPVIPGLNQTFHPVFYQAWKAGRTASAQIGWNACADLPSRTPCLDGDAKFVFGGSDTSLYDEEQMEWYPTVAPTWLGQEMYAPIQPPIYNFWSARWTGGWIVTAEGGWSRDYAVRFPAGALVRGEEGRSMPFDYPGPDITSEEGKGDGEGEGEWITPLAVLDDDSEGLGVPVTANSYDEMIRLTDAVQASPEIAAAIMAQGTSSPTGSHTGEWYLVECARAESLPSLVYELDHRVNYTVRPEAYVQEIVGEGVEGLCYLNLNVWKHSITGNGDATLISLGLGFLKGLYVVLDYERVAFGLAPLRGVDRGEV
ncbi:acid protease [Aspergillus ellipticus CBS 707.79]|uniref:Acid protease n=1 Tax=Aspergillus ellipticus CBS 707.79 TaxID=1448320 RepID=A0A319EBC1_9EURO|nr:acid protease [Aspergillus ellipticus CBS 707.79]